MYVFINPLCIDTMNYVKHVQQFCSDKNIKTDDIMFGEIIFKDIDHRCEMAFQKNIFESIIKAFIIRSRDDTVLFVDKYTHSSFVKSLNNIVHQNVTVYSHDGLNNGAISQILFD
jgi:hypothetical protein